MSIVSLGETWIGMSQFGVLYKWMKRNRRKGRETICLMNNGFHLFRRKDNSWIHLPYNKFKSPKLIVLNQNLHEEIFLKHGGHYSTLLSTAKIFVYSSNGKGFRLIHEVSMIEIPANHICLIAVSCGKLVNKLIVPVQ